jgi:lipid A 4'-phosphatase
VDLSLPFLVAMGISVWLSAGGRDLAWQRACFAVETGDWALGEGVFWRTLYDLGTLPVLIACGWAVVALVAGFRWEWWRQWRRVAWYFLALLALGSGIITNLWLKDTWGRPRPREVTEFGGRHPFEDLFAMDFMGEGKSFPCGHATAGFFFIGLWFLLRRSRPGWATVALGVSLVWGGLIGYARMLQGGHFATDVVWAAAVMWITAGGLYYAFGLDRSVRDVRPALSPGERKIPWWAKLSGGVALASLLGVVSVATPYRAERKIHPIVPAADSARFRGSISVWRGDVEFLPEATFRIDGQAWGHGVPTSEIADRWEESAEPDGTWRFKYHQRRSGYLTEVRQELEIGVPWQRADAVKLDLGPGQTRLRLPEVNQPTRIELVIRGADLTIELEAGATVWLHPEAATEWVRIPVGAVRESEDPPKDGCYLISVTGRVGGTLAIERSEANRD